MESYSHKYNSWNEWINYFQTYVQLYAYPGNFFEQKIWEVAWLLSGFLSKIFLKNKLFWIFFAYSESAQWADLKYGLIFYTAINFGNCKQTADSAEMSLLRCYVSFDAFYV